MSSFTIVPGVEGGAAWLRRGGAGTAGASAASQPRSVVGDDIELTAEHAAGLDATEMHTISCLPDYCNRIMEITGFIRVTYPDLVDSPIVELTPEQRARRRRRSWGARTMQWRIRNAVAEVRMGVERSSRAASTSCDGVVGVVPI